MSNVVIGYRILLSNSEFRTQRFRVDRDIFENGRRVDADLFYTDIKGAFSKRSGYLSEAFDPKVTSLGNL